MLVLERLVAGGRDRPDQRRVRGRGLPRRPRARWPPARSPSGIERRRGAGRGRGGREHGRPTAPVRRRRPRARAPRCSTRRRRTGCFGENEPAILKLLRGDREAMARTVAGLAGDDRQRAAALAADGRAAWSTPILARAIEASALEFPAGGSRSGRCSARTSAATSRRPWPRSVIASTGWAGSSTGGSRASATCRWRSATPGSTRCASGTGRTKREIGRALPLTSRVAAGEFLAGGGRRADPGRDDRPARRLAPRA